MSSPQEKPDPAAPVTVTLNAPLRVDGKALARSVQEHTSRHSRRERSTTDLTEQVQTGVVPSEDDPPELPAEFAGCIGIEWPAMLDQAAAFRAGRIAGWAVSLYDDAGLVTTVIALKVHASATSVIWAELWMYATEDGQPLLHPETGDGGAVVIPTGGDGEPVIGKFPFLVTSMRVKGGTA